METNDNLWTIPVPALHALIDPMAEDVWECGVITAMDIECCEDIRLGRLPAGLANEDTASIEYNVARIAWLMEKGWDANDEPITVQLMPGCDWPVIADGNHRFAAALLMGTENIQVAVEGDLDFLEDQLRPLIFS